MPHGKELPARVHAVLLLAFSSPTASVSVFRDTFGGASPPEPKCERNAGAGSRARLLPFGTETVHPCHNLDIRCFRTCRRQRHGRGCRSRSASVHLSRLLVEAEIAHSQ